MEKEREREREKPRNQKIIYVNSKIGSNSYFGSAKHPFLSIDAAINYSLTLSKRPKFIKILPGIGYEITQTLVSNIDLIITKGTQISIGNGGSYSNKCGQLICSNIYGSADFILNNCHPFILGRGDDFHQDFQFNSICGTPYAPIFEHNNDSYNVKRIRIRGNKIGITKGGIFSWNLQSVHRTKKISFSVNNMEAELLYIEMCSKDKPKHRPIIVWSGHTLKLNGPEMVSHIHNIHSDLQIKIGAIRTSSEKTNIRCDGTRIIFKDTQVDYSISGVCSVIET